MYKMNSDKIAIIGPGRLGTAFAYKWGRDEKEITIYYHDETLCHEINTTHLNPKHLTEDLGRISGRIDRVPRLAPRVTATNDLDEVIREHDFIMLAINMKGLPEFLSNLKPRLAKKKKRTCLISPIKSLASVGRKNELITPSQMIDTYLFDLKHLYDVICIGGPFFDVDLAMGNPVCVTVAGERHIAELVRQEFFALNRSELSSYYNCDAVGVEACGALKNIVANIKGIADSCDMGSSIPGTIFARSGVEMRAISKILGGHFLTFLGQAGVGDMYVTLSSDSSKNYRYGKYFYECYTENTIETHQRIIADIDGTPEGPGTLKSVYRYLESKNMYSPIFRSAYKIFNEGGTRNDIRDQIIKACQFDRRSNEYIALFSGMAYNLFPHIWYRRQKGWWK
jgi:glycerol-3-phosphate dehydrogenase (NAD(P)+)